MSDPRASIHRTVAGPPPRDASNGDMGVPTAPAAVVKTIGKAHGRMRAVNLALPLAAAVHLRRLTAERASTLGEVLMELIRAGDVPAVRRGLGRRPLSRRGETTDNVYVLLTPAEATELASLATRTGRTVSDYASTALIPRPGP